MSGLENRWLLIPLQRGAVLSLLLAGLCLTCALTERAAAEPAVETVEAAANHTETGAPARAAWPRILLRLWILAPQLTPLPAR